MPPRTNQDQKTIMQLASLYWLMTPLHRNPFLFLLFNFTLNVCIHRIPVVCSYGTPAKFVSWHCDINVLNLIVLVHYSYGFIYYQKSVRLAMLYCLKCSPLHCICSQDLCLLVALLDRLLMFIRNKNVCLIFNWRIAYYNCVCIKCTFKNNTEPNMKYISHNSTENCMAT